MCPVKCPAFPLHATAFFQSGSGRLRRWNFTAPTHNTATTTEKTLPGTKNPQRFSFLAHMKYQVRQKTGLYGALMAAFFFRVLPDR